MSKQPFDPAEFKAGQRQEWGAAAEGWRRQWGTIERFSQPVSDRLVEMTQIQPGHRVLDVATGIGEPAVTAARAVGPGSVVATDQAPEMLAIARERAADLGLLNIEFHEMDAETLNLPGESFNALLCRWGLMFLPNPGDALRGMYRLLAPGGGLAAAVWSEAPKVPMISLPMRVIQQMVEMPTPPEGMPGPFSLADVEALEQALRHAGLANVHSERMVLTADWPSANEFVNMLLDIAAPLKAILDRQPVEKRAGVLKAIEEAIAQYAAADGTIRIPNEAICVVGHKV